MRYNLIWLVLAFYLFGFKNHGQSAQWVASDIVGTFWNEEKDVKVRTFLAQNGKYSGKVIWLRYPLDAAGQSKKDINNPDASLRDRERMGLVVLKYFEYNATDERWEGGSVYDAKSGRTYSGYIRFIDKNRNKLMLRGYIGGISLLGRNAEWERVE